MSKLTIRQYKQIAKRPGMRGPGFKPGKAQPEAVRPEAEAEAVAVEEVLTDLGEQDSEMEEDNLEDAHPTPPIERKSYEQPMSFENSTIEKKGIV